MISVAQPATCKRIKARGRSRTLCGTSRPSNAESRRKWRLPKGFRRQTAVCVVPAPQRCVQHRLRRRALHPNVWRSKRVESHYSDRLLVPINQKEFHEVDYTVMKFVFAVHNELGRLYNEKIYQAELIGRLIKAGNFSVLSELPIEISFRDFIKTYYLDLVVNDSFALLECEGREIILPLIILLKMGLRRG